MTAGKPTARSAAWKIKNRSTDISDVIPPLSVEVHPSERAFVTLEVYITSAIRMAYHDPHLASLLQNSLRWMADCRDWFAEARQEIEELKTPSVQLQAELDNCNSEILALRAQNAALQTKLDTSNFQLQIYQQQLNAFGPRIREREVPPDADPDTLRSVITSLKAVIERRDCHIAHLQAQLSATAANASCSISSFHALQNRVLAQLEKTHLRRYFQHWRSLSSLALLQRAARSKWRRTLLFSSMSFWHSFAQQRKTVALRRAAFRSAAHRWVWQKWLRASKLPNYEFDVLVRVLPGQHMCRVHGSCKDLTVDAFISRLLEQHQLAAPSLSGLSLSYVDASDPKSPQLMITSDIQFVDVIMESVFWSYVFTLHLDALPLPSTRPDPPWPGAPT